MDLSNIGYETRVECWEVVDELKLNEMDWVRVNSCYLFIVLFSFSPHSFCLWLAIIPWFVMRKQMWIQVSTRMLRDGAGQNMEELLYLFLDIW